MGDGNQTHRIFHAQSQYNLLGNTLWSTARCVWTQALRPPLPCSGMEVPKLSCSVRFTQRSQTKTAWYPAGNVQVWHTNFYAEIHGVLAIRWSLPCLSSMAFYAREMDSSKIYILSQSSWDFHIKGLEKSHIVQLCIGVDGKGKMSISQYPYHFIPQIRDPKVSKIHISTEMARHMLGDLGF